MTDEHLTFLPGVPAVSSSASAVMVEEHYGIPELANQWGYSEATVRGWFLERPRLGVLVHQVRKRGKRQYISIRVSKSAAAAVYTEKCRVEPAPPQ